MAIQNSLNTPLPSTNGQLWIGKTGNLPSVTTLTAGSGVNITNGPGTITISTAGIAGLGLNWFQIGASLGVSTQPNAGYYQSSGNVPYTLPLAAVQNDIIAIVSRFPSTGFSVTVAAPGQNILGGGTVSTFPTAGPGVAFASITLICTDSSGGPGTQQFDVMSSFIISPGIFSFS